MMPDPTEKIRSLIFDINELGGKKLYHYTDTNGLMGILSSKCIWVTNYKFLNDPSEHQYGLDIVKEVVERFNKPVTNFNLDSAYQSLFVHKNANPVMERRYYVSSLTEDKDSLTQWMIYGNQGKGFAIEFDIRTDQFGDFNYFIDPIPCQVFKVIYDPNEQVRIIEEVIKIFLNSKYVIVGFDFILNYLSIKFKDPLYAHEKEWRVVYSPVKTKIDPI